MNSNDPGTLARFGTHDEDVPIDLSPEPDADETVADVLAFLRIQGVLRGMRDEFIEERPLDALALSIVVQAAGNVRLAWNTARRIRVENREAARRKAKLELHKTSDTLLRKLTKEPGVALAEARFTPEGCRRVIELWRCLGESLVSKDGWGDEEMKLARALAGSAETGVRTTRDRIRLDRAMDSDSLRPVREMVATVDRVMGHYVDRLMQGLEGLEPGQRNLHQVVLESVNEKAFELMSLIGVDDREVIARFREKTGDSKAGRQRWAATRAYVASRIREWRAIRSELSQRICESHEATEMESFGLNEMRKAEWARKGLSAAIADFHKTLALGKAIGLPDLICPKPPKTSRTAEASMPMRVDKNSLPCSVATERHDAQELKFRSHSASRTERASRNHPERKRSAPISNLPRDPLGRFLPGAICTQPRDARGRFVRAASIPSAMADAQATVVSHSLRPTESGWHVLMAITPNVAGRKQSARHENTFAEADETPGIHHESPSIVDAPAAGGAAITLADFGENGQNVGLTPMPDAPDAAEPFSGSPAEDDRGIAGDDQR